MKVVVTGATGNVGTSVLEQLAHQAEVTDIVGVARRAPGRSFAKATFIQADVARDDLSSVFAGADVVIHLAWLIQPRRDLNTTTAVNVHGSRRVFDAVARAGVPSLIYASSVGAYSPGPKDRLVDESWPTGGIETSFYSRHKAAVERILGDFEREHPTVRVVRLRPGLIFKAQAGTEVRRLFLGPFMPTIILRRGWVPVIPDLPNLRLQAVHSLDIGAAYTLAAVNPDARGPFNIAADPVIGPAELAGVLRARRVRVPRALLRGAVDGAYRLRVSPTEPGWLDLALEVPLMDCGRAKAELGWVPRHDAIGTLAEMIDAIGQESDDATPPLARSTTAPARISEVKTGLGAQA
jgi:UDP-glucose 4-epimerase